MQMLEKKKGQDISCMQRFFDIKKRETYQRTYWNYWMKFHVHKKSKTRKMNYAKNFFYRKQLKWAFILLRDLSSEEGKERIKREEKIFRQTLETEKLTMWTSKVDQLMLYMAQLEDKIKTEVQAREQLSLTYENSLNRGVNVLNKETNLLADNPLIQEISIVVAKQLLSKSKEDPEALNALLTQEQREQLRTV